MMVTMVMVMMIVMTMVVALILGFRCGSRSWVISDMRGKVDTKGAKPTPRRDKLAESTRSLASATE